MKRKRCLTNPKITVFLALAFIMTLVPIFMVSKVVLADQLSVQLSNLKGGVFTRTGGGLREYPASEGMKLRQGDWLRTDKTGTAKLIFEDGSEAMIGSNSYLMIEGLTTDTLTTSAVKHVRITSADGSHQYSLGLWAGSVWSKVKSLLNVDDQYEVETPTAVMGVRGTLYLVRVDPSDGTTESSVIDGVVGISQNRDQSQTPPEQLVSMGQSMKLVAGNEAPPGAQTLDSQGLIKNTQPELLVQITNDIIERTQELSQKTQDLQQTYKQSGDVSDLKAAIVSLAKLGELSDFGKEFAGNLQQSDKISEVKQILQENNQTIEQVQSSLDQLKTDTDKIKTDIIEAAKNAGLTQDQIDSLQQEAIGSKTTPASETPSEAPTTQTSAPTPTRSDENNNTTTTMPMGTRVPINTATPITFSGGVKLNLGSLSIPTGATVQADEVSVLPTQLPQGAKVAGKVVDFTFTGMTVSSPVDLTLPLNSDADPNNVGIFYRNGSDWEYQDTTVANGSVTATVNHFSTYGVLETTDHVNLVSQALSTNGTQIMLTFDRALNPLSIPDAADFTVTVNDTALAVNPTMVSGNTLILDLGGAASANDNITVSYTVGAKHIRDANGNSAPSFQNKAVDTTLLPSMQMTLTPSTTPSAFFMTLSATTSKDCAIYYVALLKTEVQNAPTTPQQIVKWDGPNSPISSWSGYYEEVFANQERPITIPDLKPDSEYVGYFVAVAPDGSLSAIQTLNFQTSHGIYAHFEPTGAPDQPYRDVPYREFRLVTDSDHQVLDLSQADGKTLIMSYEGQESQPVVLTENTNLWFNTKQDPGSYGFLLTTGDGTQYGARLNWDDTKPSFVETPTFSNITATTADLTVESDKSVVVQAVVLIGKDNFVPSDQDLMNLKAWSDSPGAYPDADSYWGWGTNLQANTTKKLHFDTLKPGEIYKAYILIMDDSGNIERADPITFATLPDSQTSDGVTTLTFADKLYYKTAAETLTPFDSSASPAGTQVDDYYLGTLGYQVYGNVQFNNIYVSNNGPFEWRFTYSNATTGDAIYYDKDIYDSLGNKAGRLSATYDGAEWNAEWVNVPDQQQISLVSDPSSISSVVGSPATVTLKTVDSQGNPVPYQKFYLQTGSALDHLWITQVNGQTIKSSIYMGQGLVQTNTPIPLFGMYESSTQLNPLAYDEVNFGMLKSYYLESLPTVSLTTGADGKVSITLADGNVEYPGYVLDSNSQDFFDDGIPITANLNFKWLLTDSTTFAGIQVEFAAY